MRRKGGGALSGRWECIYRRGPLWDSNLVGTCLTHAGVRLFVCDQLMPVSILSHLNLY